MSNKRRVYPQGDPNAPLTADLNQQFGAMNLQPNAVGQTTAPYTPATPYTPAPYTPAAPNTFVQPNNVATTPVPGAFNPAATPNYPAAPFNNTPTTTPNVYNTPQPTQPQFSAESQAPAKLMRMTVNCIPKTMEILNKSSIPVGCVIQPLSDEYKEPVPLIDFGSIGIVRCHICRAYMNPFMQWSKGGQSFICNLCGRANDTPAGYFSPLDPQTGRRADYPSRPELSSGVVDFVAPGEYMVRPPMPPSYIFAIDVSYYNVHSGGLQYVTHAIKHVLQLATEHHNEATIPLSDPRTKVAIITYDSSIHFYNLKQGLSQPQMLCVSDLTEAFVPQGLDLLVNLHESKQVIDTLLTRLPQMFAQSQNVQACLGPAVKAAMTVARHLGGKVLLFTAQLPSIGVGKLAARFDVKSLAPDSATLSGSDRETQLFKPQTEFYKNLALECSKLQISVDLFLLTPQYHDVTSLAPLAHLTGGQLYYYPEFQLPRDGNQLIEDVRHNLIRTTGWEGVMRVRCSKGVKVQAYHGAFFLRSSDLLALPSVDCDKAFGVQLSLQENLTTSYNFIQAALLYTTSTSERRIRVLNMCLPTTANMQDMFNMADGEAVAALLIKMAIDRALQAKLSDAREALVNKVVDILASYRQTLGTGQASAQLMLPATLTSLPLHILAMIKHPVLRAYQDVNPDLRAYHMQRVRSLSSSRTLLALYPHLYALHTLTDDTPAVLTLSSEKLDRQGAFLLDNGEVLLLWIGKAISIEFLQQVFGLSSLDGIDPTTIQINKETPLGARVSELIESLRAEKGIYQPLCVLRDGEPSSARFLSYFVEDRSKTLYSYYEFLMQLQKQVAAKFTR